MRLIFSNWRGMWSLQNSSSAEPRPPMRVCSSAVTTPVGTGLANPAPVAQTFFSDPEMKEQFRLDAIVTLVDAKHILLHLADSPEAIKQIGFADVILLNKTDLVTNKMKARDAFRRKSAYELIR
ncbi:MAG: hypothetical protein EB015_15805 [Methylocystaceae bacterium]|nr:hypothetical protein [Methylocystaceae bacterium]